MLKKFFVEKKELFSILSAMQPICSKRTTLDATASILFQVGQRELILKSTDLEISLQATCPISQSTLIENTSFLVPGRRIFDLVKELDGTIECVMSNNKFSLKSGSVDLGLHVKDPDLFPQFPERIENLMQMDGAFLSELLDRVAFLIPQNNANPALNGLFFEISDKGLMMTSTDGHCLAQVQTSLYTLEQPRSWLVPRRAVIEIKKIIETAEYPVLFFGTCGNQLVFSGESFNFFTKILVDQFPQYRNILERSNFVPAVLDRSDFMKTLRRSTCLLSGQFLATQFSFEKSMLRVSMENKDVGTLKEELALKQCDVDQLDIRFYAPYLLSGLQVFSDEKITCYLNNPARPIIFEASKPTYHITYLVMPISASTNAGN